MHNGFELSSNQMLSLIIINLNESGIAHHCMTIEKDGLRQINIAIYSSTNIINVWMGLLIDDVFDASTNFSGITEAINELNKMIGGFYNVVQ